jgi:two-component system chemotaxis response regulator CheY
MVVDDSMIMRRVIIDTLRSFTDADIVEASTGEEALDALSGDDAGGIDLVLLDWYLPGISGIEVMRRMRADPGLSGVPVVMVTSEREKSKVIEALRAGAKNYIAKPFGHEVFRKKIGPLLEEKRRPAEEERAPGGLVGNLAHTSPIEVVQLISMTKKTGVLEFEGEGRRYSIYFKDGQMGHAEGEGLQGEEAFLASTALTGGAFTFRTEAPKARVTIRRATDMLLLDAFSQATGEG